MGVLYLRFPGGNAGYRAVAQKLTFVDGGPRKSEILGFA